MRVQYIFYVDLFRYTSEKITTITIILYCKKINKYLALNKEVAKRAHEMGVLNPCNHSLCINIIKIVILQPLGSSSEWSILGLQSIYINIT